VTSKGRDYQPNRINHLLSSEQADNIRRQITNILSKSSPSNITRQERLALQDLNRNTNFIVLLADKDNTTVVMNISDYKKKKNLFSHKVYKKLDKDPINFPQNILVEKSKIPSITKSTSNLLSPRLYGLPKIHKHLLQIDQYHTLLDIQLPW